MLHASFSHGQPVPSSLMQFLKTSVASPQSNYLLLRALCSVAAQERQIQTLVVSVGVRGHVLRSYACKDRGHTQLRAGLETDLWLWGGNEVSGLRRETHRRRGRLSEQQPPASSTSAMALWLLVSDPQGLQAIKMNKVFPGEHNTLGSLWVPVDPTSLISQWN